MKQIMHITSVLLLTILSACGGAAEKNTKPLLAVSIEPQRKMLEELAGDKYEIVTMLSAGANPETYEPTVGQRKAVANAKAYFQIGWLPFEAVLAKSLDSDIELVNVSEGIEPVMGTHSHGHDSDDVEADPHVWASLRNGKIMARNMARALSALDPDGADDYQARYEALAIRLDSLDNAVNGQLTAAGAHAFAVWHPSLSYFARDYGLHQVSVGQESKEVPIAKLRSVIDEAKEDSVKVFFFQKEYDSRQAQSINAEIGSRLVTITPLAYDWEAEIISIANELAR